MGWVLFVLEFYVSCARSDCGVIPKLARNVLLFPLLKSQRARSSRKVGAGDTAHGTCGGQAEQQSAPAPGSQKKRVSGD
jgi:hypothetical protein